MNAPCQQTGGLWHFEIHVVLPETDADVTKLIAPVKECRSEIRGVVLESLLFWAVSNSQEEHTHALIELGAKGTNRQETGGKTLLMMAIARSDAKFCGMLIEAGTDVNAEDDSKESALMLATAQGNVNLVRMLKAGADVNAEDKNGNTAIYRVCHSIDRIIYDYDGNDPVYVSAPGKRQPPPNHVQLLLEAGSKSVCYFPYDGEHCLLTNTVYSTLLINATFAQCAECVGTILSLNPDTVNEFDDGNQSAFHGANTREVLKLLILAGSHYDTTIMTVGILREIYLQRLKKMSKKERMKQCLVFCDHTFHVEHCYII